MESSQFFPPFQAESTSTRLLARLRTRDPEAWRQLVRLYGPVVRYWIRRAGLNRADLADVFQEVFFAVSRNIQAFERQSGTAKFRAWLKTVTHSKIQDFFRRRGKQVQAAGGSTQLFRMNEVPAQVTESSVDRSSWQDSDDGLTSSEEAFIAQRTLNLVRNEFRENTWRAFYRSAVDGLNAQQVAAELGISAVAVRKAKSRVLARLREALGELDGKRAN